MSRGRIVGFRVSEELHSKLHDLAIEKGTTISDIVRDIVLNNLDLTYQYSQWEVHAWNYFNVNADQLAYAKKAAQVPEQFFSIISKWSKDVKIKVIPHPTSTLVEFVFKDKVYLISEERFLPKLQVIQSIVDQLVRKIEEDTINAAESLHNWPLGGDDFKAAPISQNEHGSSVSESVSGEGHTSMPNLDDLGMEEGS